MATGELGGDNILRQVYDPPTESLKVTGVAITIPGGIEVNIDHTEDSVRLGDGTTLHTGTTVGPKHGLDVNIIGSDSALDVNVTDSTTTGDVGIIGNLALGAAGTESFFEFPIGTKRIEFRSRLKARLQYAYTVGQTGITYITVLPGRVKSITGLDYSVARRIYFQSYKASDTIEIEYFT